SILAGTSLAVSTSIDRRSTTALDSRDLGVWCCQQAVSANDPSISPLLGLLGITGGDYTGLAGLNCSPMTVIGGGSG
ncbi:hypothetical protein L218DRAFT_807045, partial [Marasmius fiardii PR-910]